MTGLVEAFRQKVENSCIEDGPLRRKDCEVSQEDAPQPRVVIDLDKRGSPLGKNQTRCEYLVIVDRNGSGGWVVPMEFKSSRMRVSKVTRQLQAGARAAERLVPKQNPIYFRPVAVIDGPVNRKEMKDLKATGNAVKYRGCWEPVRVLRCGDLLTEVLGT